MCKIKKLYGTNVEREKNMGRYIIKRILWMIPILICVAILVFTMMYFVPGDTAQIVLGSSATPEQLEQYRELHGLNAPYISRLVSYLGSLLHGDFGTSYIYSTSVMSDLLTRFPRTFIIAIGTVIIGVVVGVPFGIWAAIKQDSIADRLILIISLVGASMPSFWLGLMLVILFAFMYFFMIRPQKKETQKKNAMLSELATGDTVLTTSGFYGTVIDITDDTVIVEFGSNKNCRIPMQKSAIAAVEKPEEA